MNENSRYITAHRIAEGLEATWQTVLRAMDVLLGKADPDRPIGADDAHRVRRALAWLERREGGDK